MPRLHHEGLGHAEDGVGRDILVVAVVDCGHQFPVARRADEEVGVGRAAAVAALGADHGADRAVHGDFVAERQGRAERVTAVLVGLEAGAMVHRGGIRGLQVVGAVGIGLPYLDDGVRDGCDLVVADGAEQADLLAVQCGRDAVA